MKLTFHRPFAGMLELCRTFYGCNTVTTGATIERLVVSNVITADDSLVLTTFLTQLLRLRLMVDVRNKQRYDQYDAETQKIVDELLVLKEPVSAIFNRILPATSS